MDDCAFCGVEATEPDWVTFRKGAPYGTGPGTEDMWLCQFCRRSYAVSWWLVSGKATNLEKDLMASMNSLRTSLLEALKQSMEKN